MLGLPNAISFFIGRSNTEEDKQTFISTYYIFNTLLSIISGCVLFLLIYPISVYFSNGELLHFWFFVLIFGELCRKKKSSFILPRTLKE